MGFAPTLSQHKDINTIDSLPQKPHTSITLTPNLAVYGFSLLGWLMGVEPTTTGITIRDSTTELQPPSTKTVFKYYAY